MMVAYFETLFVDGRWRKASGPGLDVVNPAYENRLVTIHLSSKAEATAAPKAARKTLDWGRLPTAMCATQNQEGQMTEGIAADGTQKQGPPKLRVDGVSMVFGSHTVFKGVDLEVAAGEFVCLIGASGCGKTTLLNLIAGFMTPTEGEVRVSGRAIHGPGADRAMVFQDDAVFPWFTVLQNVEYGLKLRRLPKHERRAQARELVELVGLGGREDAFPAQLSGGMRKRVDVARALAVQPDVLLMDEPFAALDAITKARMQAEFLRLWENRQTTVLFVTHDIEEALFLGDRIVMMGGGGIVQETAVPFVRPRTEEVRTSPALQAMRSQLIEAHRQWPQASESDT